MGGGELIPQWCQRCAGKAGHTPDAPAGGVDAARLAYAAKEKPGYAAAMSSTTIESILRRSRELDAAVWGALPDPYLPAMSSPRHDASLSASLMAVEHSRAFQLLVS